MRKKRNLCCAALLAAALVLQALSFRAEAVNLDQICSLTVAAGSEELEADLNNSDVVIDMYRVAEAVPVTGYDAYEFRMLEDYDSLTIGEDMDGGAWNELAQKAAAIALGEAGDGQKSGAPLEPVVKGASQNVPSAVSSGLYLLIARSSKAEDYVTFLDGEDGTKKLATFAYSDEYVYTFEPVLVALPSKEEDENGVVSTANPGDWLYDLGVTLKPERELRFGSLRIVKELDTYETKNPAVFVFSVEATMVDARGVPHLVYSNVVSTTFTEPGEQEIIVDRIPVGAQVVIEEVYSGASYTIMGQAEQTAVVEATDIVGVHFTNTYEERDRESFGITNHFEYTQEAAAGDSENGAEDGGSADYSWSWDQE